MLDSETSDRYPAPAQVLRYFENARRFGIGIGGRTVPSTHLTISGTLRWGYTFHMLKLTSNDVLECVRVEDSPVPSTHSFMSDCAQCNAPIWVPCISPIEPKRMC